MSFATRRAQRLARRRRDAELDRIGRLFDSGAISVSEYVDRSKRVRESYYTPEQVATLLAEDEQRMRTAAAVHEATRPPDFRDFLRCPVCSHVAPDHSDACILRPGADLRAPRGGIAYDRRPAMLPGARWDAHGGTTPLYDELAAERGIDPCREAALRRDEETFRELSARFARSARVPGPLMLVQEQQVIRASDDPVVEHARELYRLGHFGDVGTLTARRALARMISGRALDDVRPRTRTGWGVPIERTDP